MEFAIFTVLLVNMFILLGILKSKEKEAVGGSK